MASDIRIGGAKAMGAAVVLGWGLLWSSSVARADYSYTFTLTPLDVSGADAAGMFTLDSNPSSSFALFTGINASLYSGGSYYTIDDVIRGSNVRNYGIGSSVGAVFLGPGSSLSFSGSPIIGNNEINGTVRTIYSTSSSYTDGTSLFDAVLSSGSSSGGGSSGGAPTPEVNAALSLAIAGATVAFLRRKRGGRSGPIAA